MKNRMIRALAAMCLASVLLAGTAVTVSAAEPNGARQPDYSKQIEEMTKWLDGMTVTQSGGASAPANQPGNAAAPKILTGDELKAYTDTIFELVNKEREKAGLQPLDYREDIAGAATIRAREIVSSYTHTRPDGSKFSTVFDELEITKRTSGENLYKSPTTPEAAVKGWMASDGHRNNILKEKYTATGTGIYQDQDGKLYWVQLFIQEK